MTKINKREENPKLGMPNELLYSVAKQFGWNLSRWTIKIKIYGNMLLGVTSEAGTTINRL